MESVKKYELSNFEKGLVEFTLKGEFLTMATSFLDITTEIELDKIKSSSLEALKHLQRRHPFLRGHLNVEGDNVFVVVEDDKEAADKIDLEIIDLTKATPTRRDLIDTCALFNSTEFNFLVKLVWRTQLIIYKEENKTKLVFNLVFPLLVIDGFSITTLSIEFVNILNALLTNKTCIEMKEQIEACGSIHEYFHKSGLYNEEHKKFASALKSERIDFIFNPIFQSIEESGFYMDLFKFDKPTSDLIISTSKKFNVRLTAYFYNVAFYTMKKLYDENQLELPKRFALDFAINLRIRFDPNIPFSTPRLFSTYAEPVTEEAHYGRFTDFWKESQYIQTLVEKYSDMKTGAALKVIYQTLDAEISEEDDLTVDFCLSNLGAFVSNSVDVFPGPIDIKEMYCSDSMKAYPRGFITVQVHVFYWKGELMIQFGANKAYFQTTYCKRFTELFKQVIQESLN